MNTDERKKGKTCSMCTLIATASVLARVWGQINTNQQSHKSEDVLRVCVIYVNLISGPDVQFNVPTV